MRDRVGLGRVMEVVGCEWGGRQTFRYLGDRRVAPALLGDLVILELDEQIVSSEDVLKSSCPLESFVEVALDE